MEQANNKKTFENFLVALHKPWDHEKRKLLFPIGNPEKENRLLKRFIGDRADLRNFDFNPSLIQELCERQKTNAEDLLIEPWRVSAPIIKAPKWRLATGIGEGSVYDTSITLHHIYGIPYIRGSAIKGITHHFALGEKYEQLEIDEVFGSDELPDKSIKGRKGRIIFFDAFPLTSPTIEPDVMTPHYPEYYGKENPEPPADWQSPNPIGFLTVGSQTKFQFLLGVKPKFGEKEEEAKPLLEMAEKWLGAALELKGIGAKTAVGYGYMK